MKKIISTHEAPKPVGSYNQAVRVGKFLFVSGQLAIDPKEGKIVASDIKGQTERTMENTKAILKAAGYSLGDVVQANVYLSSLTLFSDFNGTYAKYFDKDFPARTTVATELFSGHSWKSPQ
jgi:2-iminobutanoate/2-iminopropanoate deaminase